jgi:hypothetical protein
MDQECRMNKRKILDLEYENEQLRIKEQDLLRDLKTLHDSMNGINEEEFD